MSNELKHKDVGTGLARTEWENEDVHEADGQTLNDMLYFNDTYWVRATPATILTLLTAVAAAAFSWNNQQLNAVKQIQYKSETALSISAGVATVSQLFHTIDTENNDPSDDLDTLNGGTEGMFVVFRLENGSRTVTLKHGTGNIIIPGGLDFTMEDANDIVLLIFTNSNWRVLSSSSLKSLFDANTILKADTDDTPEALTVPEQTIIGRITSGVITALTATQVMALLSGGAGADFSMNTNKLTSVKNPTNAQDAATKGYVDTVDDAIVAAYQAHVADTSTHGAADIADVSDIAVDANLSAEAQDAISKRHTQGTDTSLGTLASDINMGDNHIINLKSAKLVAVSELTLDAIGAIVPTQHLHTVDTYEDAASDNLDTITNTNTLSWIVLRAENDGRTVVVRHNQGNIWLQGGSDVSLDDIEDGIMLFWDTVNSKWFDIAAGGGGGAGISNVVEDATPQLGGDLDVNEKAITDGDGDTKFQLEEGADDDTARIYIAGVEAFKLSSVGILTLAKQSYVDMYNDGTYYQYGTSSVYNKVLLNAETVDSQNEGDVTVITGTNTSTSTSKLIDSGGGLSGAAVGWGVYNATDNTYALVTAVDSDTQLSLDTNIFPAPAGDNYWVFASRITITEDGKYKVILQGGIDDIDPADYWGIYCYKNGANLTSINHVASQANELLIIQKNDIVDLSAGDYLEMFCWHNQGASQWIRYTRAVGFITVFKVA